MPEDFFAAGSTLKLFFILIILRMMSESFESERKNSLDDPSGAETVDTNHDSEAHDSGSEVEEIMMDDGRERVI